MTMTAEQAAEFLNTQVAWEPGLRVRATCERWGMLGVRLDKTGTDSSAVQPDGRYRESEKAVVTAEFSFTPYQYETPEVLLYHVIRQVAEVHEHEIREFTRFRGGEGPNGWTAPFHPHNPEGNKLWNLRGNGNSGITPYGREAVPASREEATGKEKGNDSEG